MCTCSLNDTNGASDLKCLKHGTTNDDALKVMEQKIIFHSTQYSQVKKNNSLRKYSKKYAIKWFEKYNVYSQLN